MRLDLAEVAAAVEAAVPGAECYRCADDGSDELAFVDDRAWFGSIREDGYIGGVWALTPARIALLRAILDAVAAQMGEGR